jgi:UDP-N-acetylglucosamine 2-epimerase (non-hydrolysing)
MSDASSRRLRIVSIVGTRPEAIKIAPIAIAAAARPHFNHQLIATGQHDGLFDSALEALGVKADRMLRLGAGGGRSIDSFAAEVATAVADIIAELEPDMLLVQGDTTTAWAAALAGQQLGTPVGHVEAGLRSHDPMLPWPEERNRVEIDAVSTLLFAPSEAARANLAAEPAVRGRIHVTGNSGIDALLRMRAIVGTPAPDPGRKLILVTCHRRENIGTGIANIGQAIHELARRPDVRIIVPVHPNPEVRAGIEAAVGNAPGITLLPPLDYREMVRLMSQAWLILSDSGGLQEEAPALGVPLLLLRDNSERPEALAAGNIALVGTDPVRIVAAAERLLDDRAAHAAMSRPAFPYGDGDAANKILDAIEDYFAR